MDDKLLSCGEFAKFCGVSRKTLIFYDNNNILKPYETSASGYRYYHPKQVQLVKMVKAYQTAGLSLDEIKDIIYSKDQDNFADIVRKQAEELEKQIRDLEITRRILVQTAENEKFLREHPIGQLFREKHVKTYIISQKYSTDYEYYSMRGPVSGGIYYVDNHLKDSPDYIFRLPIFTDEIANDVIDEGNFICSMVGTYTVHDAIGKFRSLTYEAGIVTENKFFFIDMSNDMIIDNKKESILKIMARVTNI